MSEAAPLLAVNSVASSRAKERCLLVGVLVLAALLAAALAALLSVLFALWPAPPSLVPDKRACNDNGIRTQWAATGCECFQCWQGPTCAQAIVNCTIDATVAQAGMYEEAFESMAPEAQRALAPHTVPAWWQMAYQMPFVVPSPWASSSPLLERVWNTLAALHDNQGNLDTNGKSLVWGCGSTQVIRSLMYAASRRAGRPLWLVARAPFYATFKLWAQENSYGTTLGFTQRTDLNPADVVEIVTWPNNPDGAQYPPMYPNAQLVIHDLVYYWPSSFPGRLERLDVDAAVFSMSKMTGHASSRFGWAYVKDPALAMQTIGFFSVETFQASVDGIQRSLSIIEARPQLENFFNVTRETFAQRGRVLSEMFAMSTDYELVSVPGTWFAWIKCLRNDNCAAFSANLIDGEWANGDAGVPQHIRLNLNLRESVWRMLLERLGRFV